MISKRVTKNSQHRLAVFLPLVLCVFLGTAQISIQQRLSNVLAGYDINEHKQIYKELLQYDLTQFPDSTLFDYHLLASGLHSNTYAEETGDSSMLNPVVAISHLLEAKKICEKSLGTHSQGYMHIMVGLGNEYFEIGQIEEALGSFQEGIIKSSYFRNVYPQTFGNLIIGIQKCYEYLGWYSEIPNLLYDAWSLWPKEDISLGSYAYYPLWNLHQFYRRYEMYEEAIHASDLIMEFISQNGGSNHPELAEELYFRGNTLNDMGKTEEAIEAYKNGLSILETNKLEFDSDRSYYPILGNLLLALLSIKKWNESDIILNKIKELSDNCKDAELYNSTLTAVAITLFKDGQYAKALNFTDQLLERNIPDKRKETAKGLREEILYSQEIIRELPELEQLLQNTKYASNEWFDIGLKLTSAYSRKKNSEKYMLLLESMYTATPINKEAKDEYYVAILSSLFNVCLDHEMYDLALKYALENLEYISTLSAIPERYKFNCLNNVVVAKLKSNKLDGIYEDLEKAEMLCRNVFGEESETFAVVLHNKGRAFQLDGKYEDAKRLYLAAINLHTKTTGSPGPNTAKYLMETEKMLVDYELDL